MITLGILIAYIVDYGTKDIHSAASYKIPIGLQCIWGVILCANFSPLNLLIYLSCDLL